jgi:purine catabolism regulator
MPGPDESLKDPRRDEFTATLPLRVLVRDTNLGLQVVGRADITNRSISWVYVSELPNPGPWLDGGELVLTLASWLRTGRTSADEYVRRLVANGAGALAVLAAPPGELETFPEIPAELIDAADRHDLPLLHVPGEVTFLAVTKTIAYALASRTAAVLSEAVDAQDLLVREAVGPAGGLPAVAARLRRTLGVWVLVLGPAGEVHYCFPALDPERIRRIGADLRSMSHEDGPGVVPLISADESVVAHRMQVAGRPRGHVVLGRPTPLTTPQRRLVSVAVGVCALLLDREEADLQVAGRLRQQYAAALLAGDAAAAGQLAELIGIRLPAEPVVVAALDSAVAGPVARDAAYRRAREALGRALVAADDEHQLVVLRSDAGAPAEHVQGALDAVPDLVAGVATPVVLAELPAARRRAEAALAEALRSGTRIVDLTTRARRELVDYLTDADSSGFVDRLIGPLRQYDEQNGSELIGTLRCWLAHFGQWEPSAADLGVHRNTLRHRIARIEQVLGTSLDSAQVRSELWLALQVAGYD